ncbi:MAG: HypC/HybG/HupF family hydrogenase formation chaperone [Phycisphaerales bacterium]|nr:HypC/HybG/HupF family hydrogenase formation chaperone [Phycisphaerales bacterium]MCB9854370.1 HypC/HybG/HupF family hydrogenase formation chaperone [Phycisphaerales bacterium]MCB9863571.1 HypC/HybG/HupF family hydrogenase formation chaperone [Phycisphaerales bacterium]
MCLAVPAKVISLEGEDGVVDLGGNRLSVRMALTPGIRVDQWVLVHAGFSIAKIETSDALETWGYLKACYAGDATGLDRDADEMVASSRVAAEGTAR